MFNDKQKKNVFFDEGQTKSYQNIKKQFDLGLEQQLLNMGSGNSNYTSDTDNEQIFNQNRTINAYYHKKSYQLPQQLLELESLADFISLEDYQKLLTNEEQASLNKLLPSNMNSNDLIKDLFGGKLNYFGINPIEFFLELLKEGNFTRLKAKEQEIEFKLYQKRMQKHFIKIYNELSEKIEEENGQFKFEKVQSMMAENQLKKLNLLEELENLSDANQNSIQSIQDIEIKHNIEDCISDLDNMSNESFSGKPLQFDYQQPGQQLISGFEMLPTQFQLNQNSQFMDPINQELDFTLSENRKIEQQKALAAEAQKLKRSEIQNGNDIFLSISDQVGGQHQIINIPPAKASKATKSAPTIKQGSKDWILNYRRQEAERYQYPTKPWRYYLSDGTTAIVAPVAKKITLTNSSKPRDHFLLKSERPPFITILCLVRDAAARLPTFTGTRADICELLKESSYINEHTPDDKLSNIVSGALDRLHYEDDPCVKYDSEKKVWIYLHSDRDENYSAWIEQSDSRSSKKKEYNLKYKNKKKVKQEETRIF